MYCGSTLAFSYTLKRSYFSDYLCSGMALDGTTPYEGTLAIPPDSALISEHGEYQISAYPIRKEGAPGDMDAPLEKKSTDLLRSACWTAKTINQPYLTMSGGKDSRTLACTLYAMQVDNLHIYTFGGSQSSETLVAKQVADCLGYPFEIRPMRIIADPLKAAGISNAASDGLGINLLLASTYQGGFFAHYYKNK